MTRTYTITPETVDIDVCYGDYDGHVSKEMFFLVLSEFGVRVDWNNFLSEETATSVGERFVMTGELI